MTDAPPSIVSHVSLGTNDVAKATAFYDAVLTPLGVRRLMEHEGAVVAYGRAFPEFWVGLAHDGKPATVGNGTHIGFLATSKEQVQAFYDAAIAAGAKDDGKPGPRP
jgi:catechol 2,3-dioxygenase-like lactoylglutathione lyase family enzyme